MSSGVGIEKKNVLCPLTYINATVAPGHTALAPGRATPASGRARVVAPAHDDGGRRGRASRRDRALAAGAAPVGRARSPRGRDPGRERRGAGDLPAPLLGHQRQRPTRRRLARLPARHRGGRAPASAAPVLRRRPRLPGDGAPVPPPVALVHRLRPERVDHERLRDERRHAVPRPARDAGARGAGARQDRPRAAPQLRRRRRLRARPGVPRQARRHARADGGDHLERRAADVHVGDARLGRHVLYAVLSPPAGDGPHRVRAAVRRHVQRRAAVVPAVADARRRCAGARGSRAPSRGSRAPPCRRRRWASPRTLRSRRTPTAASPP